MISGLVLKYLNGECFVICGFYKYTLLATTEFNLTVPSPAKPRQFNHGSANCVANDCLAVLRVRSTQSGHPGKHECNSKFVEKTDD